MSVPDENSVYCNFRICGVYNVNGYCKQHLVEFFNWIKRNNRNLTEDNFEYLKKEFDKIEKREYDKLIKKLKLKKTIGGEIG